MMINIWTITEALIVVLGISTTILSLYASRKFIKSSNNPLGTPIGFTLMGEAIMGGATTLFATLALFGEYQLMPPTVAAALRVLMFSVAGLTTFKLITVIKVIQR